MTTPTHRFDRFLAHLDSVFQMEPRCYPVDALDGGPKVVCMVYTDVPETGSITGVTYGLSEGHHPDWKFGKPELIISVDSANTSWPLAIADMAARLRGDCPFCYDHTINFGEPISDDSSMSAFVLFAPSVLEREDHLGIDVGGDLPINLVGAYPIYASEIDVLRSIGLEAFWHHPNFDLYDVRRPRVTANLTSSP